MPKKIVICLIALSIYCLIQAAPKTKTTVKTPPKLLNYYYALMEYYALYSDGIGASELNEAFIVMYPEKYILHGRDNTKHEEDLNEVDEKLQKILPETEKGAHEYSVLLKTAFGNYDPDKEAFTCNIVNGHSCLVLPALEGDINNASMQDNGQSIILRGIMFGKVNRINIFFVNTEKFGSFDYPPGKAEEFLKNRADSQGKTDKEVYAAINLVLLPKHNNYIQWKDVKRKIYPENLESNYLMLARIKSIEIYEDPELKHKMGSVGEVNRAFQTLKLQ